ncbi:MAG: ankyrin repeat domain-containing protein, partial [Myxococcaceae bacterium]
PAPAPAPAPSPVTLPPGVTPRVQPKVQPTTPTPHTPESSATDEENQAEAAIDRDDDKALSALLSKKPHLDIETLFDRAISKGSQKSGIILFEKKKHVTKKQLDSAFKKELDGLVLLMIPKHGFYDHEMAKTALYSGKSAIFKKFIEQPKGSEKELYCSVLRKEAIAQRKTEAIKILLEPKACPFNNSSLFLDYGYEPGHQTLLFLIQNEILDLSLLKEEERKTLLSDTINNKNHDLLKAILEKGAIESIINSPDEMHKTPLQWALMLGDKKAAHLLREHGAIYGKKSSQAGSFDEVIKECVEFFQKGDSQFEKSWESKPNGNTHKKLVQKTYNKLSPDYEGETLEDLTQCGNVLLQNAPEF